jgi:hypothetical protein
MVLSPFSDDGILYDAVLTRVDPTAGILVFTVGGTNHCVTPSSMTHWTVGSVGRLSLPTTAQGFSFHRYADDRLRRAPGLDDLHAQRWGWRIGERRFQVRAGVIPGRDGAVVRRDTEFVELELPREFLDFCAVRGLPPQRVLRGFVANLCELFNWVICPREDGYSSNGSDERMYARQYFQRTYGWVDDPEYRATVSARRNRKPNRGQAQS